MKNLRELFGGLVLVFTLSMNAQAKMQEFVHQQSEATNYEWPTDSLVLKKLDHWRDLKFGVIFHWGLYAVPGIVESWGLCSEEWITRYEHNNYQ